MEALDIVTFPSHLNICQRTSHLRLHDCLHAHRYARRLLDPDRRMQCVARILSQSRGQYQRIHLAGDRVRQLHVVRNPYLAHTLLSSGDLATRVDAVRGRGPFGCLMTELDAAPRAKQRLYDEYRDSGQGYSEFAEREDTYLHQCVLEALRIAPSNDIVLLQVQHTLLVDQDYLFEEGDYIACDVRSAQRIPAWAGFDENEWYPERFGEHGMTSVGETLIGNLQDEIVTLKRQTLALIQHRLL